VNKEFVPWIPEGDWHKYEAYIFGLLQRRFPNPIGRVSPNVHLLGIKSGRQRQTDVLVEVNVGGSCLKIAVDCKCYKRRVSVNDVERFLGMLDDVKVSKGVLVTTEGYSKTALKRAQQEARDIDLQILPPERLSDYQFIGDVLLWKGRVLAIVSTPDGWLADNQDTGKLGGCQFSMYPLGHTLESAKRMCPFLYGNIVLKSETEPTMEAIAQRHEREILEKFPNARFERLPSPFPAQQGMPSRILFRVGNIDSSYGGPEYSLYLDGPNGVLALVLLCPEGTDYKYVPALKWIGGGAVLANRIDEP
jgi:Restriction endonuclease